MSNSCFGLLSSPRNGRGTAPNLTETVGGNRICRATIVVARHDAKPVIFYLLRNGGVSIRDTPSPRKMAYIVVFSNLQILLATSQEVFRRRYILFSFIDEIKVESGEHVADPACRWIIVLFVIILVASRTVVLGAVVGGFVRGADRDTGACYCLGEGSSVVIDHHS